MKYHLDIVMREASISRPLHARLLTVVHHQILTGQQLAPAWPDWKNKQGELGLLFRVFGTQEGLRSVEHALQGLRDADLIRLYPTALVPATHLRIVYQRDRSMDKFSPSRAARRERRAGGTPLPIEHHRPEKSPHYLLMQSTTTGQNFALYIKRTTGSQITDKGDSHYGLGKVLPDF